MRVAHHPLTSSIFALLIQLTPRAAHETRKNCALFVTLRAVTLVFTWEPLALWRWPVKVILSWKTVRWKTRWSVVWELQRLSCSRCSAFIFLGNLADFFSLSCCKVCEYAGCGTRRGGVVVVQLSVWVRKSILDSDWPFTYDGQSRIPVLGVYRISERLRLLHCAVWRPKRRFKHLLVTTGWSIRTVFAFFLNKLMVVDQQLILRLINIPGFCVFVCLSAQFRRGQCYKLCRPVNCNIISLTNYKWPTGVNPISWHHPPEVTTDNWE